MELDCVIANQAPIGQGPDAKRPRNVEFRPREILARGSRGQRILLFWGGLPTVLSWPTSARLDALTPNRCASQATGASYFGWVVSLP